MKICKRCVLPESFPGIRFDETGICNHCKLAKGKDMRNQAENQYRAKFLGVAEKVRGTGPYDVLMAYSGGKDSTYTLMLLKRDFGLRVLAVTLDNGFVSPAALKNIRRVTGALDVDHMTTAPGEKTLREVFVRSMNPNIYPLKALERASSICNSCMNLVKSFLLKTAIEMGVPIVAYGWSPGQAPVQSSVFKTNASMIRQMQKGMTAPLKAMVGERLSGFLLSDEQTRSNDLASQNRYPVLVHPLAFLDYDEGAILKSIREMGWEDPKDTDANSTNCLLNGFANEVHMKHFGFHPYAFEIAGLVRGGYMSREEGLSKLSAPADPVVVGYVKKKLGINSSV